MIYLGGELLQSSNVDWSFFRCVEVAASDTEVRRGTDHSTGESERIIG